MAFEPALEATGNGPFGRGARGPIPMLLTLQAKDVVITPEAPLRWSLQLRAR